MAGNSSPISVRARKEFGWSPRAPAMSAEVVEEDIREALESGSL